MDKQQLREFVEMNAMFAAGVLAGAAFGWIFFLGYGVVFALLFVIEWTRGR